MKLLSVRGPVVRMPWLFVLLGWAVVAGKRLGVASVRHPWVTLGLALAGAITVAGQRWGWPLIAAVLGVLLMALGGWGETHPASFERVVGRPWRSRIRRIWVYRRHWDQVLTVAKLNPGGHVPRLVSVDSSGVADTVLVEPVAGQTLDDWRAAIPRLTAGFRVRSIRVRRGPRAGYLTLYAAHRSAASSVPLHVVDEELDEAPASPRGAFPRSPR